MLLLLIANQTSAQSFAVKANAGLLGLGGEVSLELHKKFNIRAGANFMSGGYLHETDASAEYDIDASMKLANYSAMVDWYPYGTGFRLITGVIYNNNTINTKLLPKQSYTVGNDVYSPDELGNLVAELTFSPIKPYLGMGFGNPFKGSSFGMNLEFGVLLQGPPKVTMTGEGLIAPSAAQAPILQENMSWFTAYPVMTLSFYYRIN